MEITVRRKLLLNLGRYESMEYEATITGIPGDTDPDDISSHLDLLCYPEVQRAVLASSHDPGDNTSSVYTWDDIVTASKEGADA